MKDEETTKSDKSDVQIIKLEIVSNEADLTK